VLQQAYQAGHAAAFEKLGVRVPFLHGTSGAWPQLRPGVGRLVFEHDPNSRAVYTAISNRDKLKHLRAVAQKAVDAKGGMPLVARGKMDTQKGWAPFSMSAEGERTIGGVDDARDLIQELDAGAQEPRRGELWRLLQRGTGAWRNDDLTTPLTPTKYKP